MAAYISIDGTSRWSLFGNFTSHSDYVRSVAILGPTESLADHGQYRKDMEYGWRMLKTLEGHSSDVNSVAILGPDRIVSGSSTIP